MWAAYERRGLEAILDFAAPDAEWAPYTAGGRSFSTTEDYRSFIDEMSRREEVVEATLGEIREYGDSCDRQWTAAPAHARGAQRQLHALGAPDPRRPDRLHGVVSEPEAGDGCGGVGLVASR
jgi:hypothetical protein